MLNPGWRLWPAWLDVFPSYKLVPRIACPTLIMHVSERAGSKRVCAWAAPGGRWR